MSDETIQPDRIEFFITELEKIDADNERRYLSLTRRVGELEEKNRKTFSDDPAALMGGIFIVLIGLQLLPVILDMVKQWRSSSSSLSSA